MKSKYKKIIIVIVIFLCSCSSTNEEDNKVSYGVFIALNSENIETLYDYDLVVIDAEFFSKQDIEKLHNKNVTVYTYLNIGTIETYREAYSDFRDITLSNYDDWPDEYWVDVSNIDWQTYINNQVKLLSEKGIDGFWLDNTDVYYMYHNESIRDGLITIIKGIETFDKDIVINGGDAFVDEVILNTSTPSITITGVNQECVYTNIDFDNEDLIIQEQDTKFYYQEYLAKCKDLNLDIYLLEYTSNSSIIKDIETYAKANEFKYYIADSMWLE